MNGNDKAVLDSNFLIYLSKGKIDRALLEATYDRLYVSIVTYIEVYGYDFSDPSEKLELDDVFKFLDIIDIDRQVADLCIAYRKNKTKKIKLPDAVILASARSVGGDLVTNNLKDFENIDPTVTLVGVSVFTS